MENSITFFKAVINNSVSVLDIHNFIERNTQNNLKKLEVLKDDLDKFEVGIICDNAIGTLHGVRPNYRQQSISQLFHEFKTLLKQVLQHKRILH